MHTRGARCAPDNGLHTGRDITITDIPYLRDGINRDVDIPLTLDYMTRRYVGPIRRHVDLTRATVADCAGMFGWARRDHSA